MASTNPQSRSGQFSPEESARLNNANIVFVGCGGVGSTVAERLARLGIGTGPEGSTTYIDPESYEEANLTNQPLCTKDTLGMNKAEVVARFTLGMQGEGAQPNLRVVPYGIDAENIGDLFSNVAPKKDGKQVPRLIVDGTAVEHMELGVMVARTARHLGVPVLSAFSNAMFGAWVTTYHPKGPIFEEAHLGFRNGRNMSLDEFKERGDMMPLNRVAPFIAPYMDLGSALRISRGEEHPTPSPISGTALAALAIPEAIFNIIGGENRRRLPTYFKRVRVYDPMGGGDRLRTFTPANFYLSSAVMAVRSIAGRNPRV